MADENYSQIEIMEGKPVRDELVALVRKHDLGSRCGGWSTEQVALYLEASLHALLQISPERWNGHTPRAGS
jgi:hypothetical protein